MTVETQRSRSKSYQQPTMSPKAKRAPLFIQLTVLVFVAVAVLMALVVGVAKLSAHISNPLAPYVDILPGRVKSVLVPLGFRCYADSDMTELCALNSAQGAVESIRVIVRFNVIQSVNFRLRSGVLRIGDLALLWGKPEVECQREQFTNITWRHLNARVTVTSSGNFSYFLPVETISFGESSIALIRAL